MKIAKHICFHYQEDRIPYLNQLIDAASLYEDDVDVFIHTHNNKKWLSEKIHKHDNLSIEIIEHNMKEHAYFLTWKPRKLMREQIKEDNYDTYMYVEDDILVSNSNIKYWKKNFVNLYQQKINLGFIRTEIKEGKEFWTDSCGSNHHAMLKENNMLDIGIIDYCAFWIYSKELTARMLEIVKKPIKVNYCREKAAFGANLFVSMPGTFGKELTEIVFNKTIIPLEDGKLPKDCQVYHLPNNYISTSYCNLAIENIVGAAETITLNKKKKD
tara:strand:+ start:556 stop:1365 length:810 start_codon:yes stop_codon:yes gene_type:complete